MYYYYYDTGGFTGLNYSESDDTNLRFSQISSSVSFLDARLNTLKTHRNV